MEKLDNFCGETFWDLNQTWYTENPDFTRCFQDTVLVWFPSGFLVLFAALDIYFSFKSGKRGNPCGILSVAKSGVCALLILCQIYHLTRTLTHDQDEEVFPVQIYTPVIKGSTFVLALGLLHYSRARGVCSSGIQFLFWFLLTLCEMVSFRSRINTFDSETDEKVEFGIHMIYFPLVLVQFILSCWADVGGRRRTKTEEVLKMSHNKRFCPEYQVSFLNTLIFSWFDSEVWKGYRKPLEYSDLWNLNYDHTSSHLVPIYQNAWKKTLKQKGKFERTGKKDKLSISPALMSSFGLRFFITCVMRLVVDLMSFLPPRILSLLINFVNDPEAEIWKGYLYAACLFLTAFFSTILDQQYAHFIWSIAMRIRTVLVSAIYKKALVLSNASKKGSTIGEIVNLMSVDVQRMMDVMPHLPMVLSLPMQVGVALYFLYGELGVSAFSGLGVMAILIPFSMFIGTKIRESQLAQMKHKDSRVKLMNEILSGIKVLKLMSWEPSFEEQVLKIRELELKTLRRAAYLNAFVYFLWSCAPFLVTVATFATYVLIDDQNVLSPEKAFVSLSLFNIMNFPLGFLPIIIASLTQSAVSIDRLNKFMNMDEIDESAVTHDPEETDPVVIENGNFSWGQENITVLKDINLRVKQGSLVAVVGTVGSGKSSLLSAILGELEKQSGRVNTQGSIGYVAQLPWIQNLTVRENITFGRAFDAKKYNKVIQACALKHDLDILPGGDQTEIGEKGINLSGGQKQRVSLARSVYYDSDLYLFDDTLSAVDSHVGKHIFDQVLGPKGLLKKKTRILVTHGIGFLPQMDQIFVLSDGRITEQGTYHQLIKKKGTFAEFIIQHISGSDADAEDMINDPSVLQEIEGIIGSLDSIQKTRSPKKSAGHSESDNDATIHRKRHSATSRDSHGTQRSTRRQSLKEKDQMLQDKNKIIEKEKAETESVKSSVYLDYFRNGTWTMSLGTILLYFLFQACQVGGNLWLSEWSNEPLVNGTISTEKRDRYLWVYSVLGLGQAIFVFLGSTVMAICTLKSSAAFHSAMLHRIMRCPMSFFDITPSGRIVNRFSKDVDVADNTLPQNVRLWLNCFFQVVATLFIISYSTPMFLAVILPIGILYFLVQKFYISTSRQLKRLESVTRSPIYSHFGETVTGAPTIRAYGEQDRFILESEKRVDLNQMCYYPSMISNRWLAIRLEAVGHSVIFFAALFAVLGKDSLSSGLVGLSITYSLQITMALKLLVRWTCDVETQIVAIERLQEYVDAPQEAAWEIPEKRPKKEWPQNGVVLFEKYQSRYREGLDLVLKNVTCRIEGGQKIGIVGRTGAGKSSLTLGLFRIVEAAGGSITIDGENIANLGLHDVRGRLTIIPQEPVLFSGTLRINLDPFEQYSDAEIWRALELAHLKPVVEGLSGNLQHEIAEGGDNLSIGQRQLVCLARALLRKTKILVLDEATAAMDLETDDLIQETIRREFKDSTVLTIAHRLNTILDSTKVLVMDQGEVREFDTVENLLQNEKSLFFDMAKDAGISIENLNPQFK